MSSVRYPWKHRQLLILIGCVEHVQPSLQFRLHLHFFVTTAFDNSHGFGTEIYLVILSLCLS
jgi:hypothetical protein